MRDAGDVSYHQRAVVVFADPHSALLKPDARQRLELAFFVERMATQAELKTKTPLVPDCSLKVLHGKLSDIRKERS